MHAKESEQCLAHNKHQYVGAILINSDLGGSGRQKHLLSPSVLPQNLLCGIEMAHIKKKKKKVNRLQNNFIVIPIWEEIIFLHKD